MSVMCPLCIGGINAKIRAQKSGHAFSTHFQAAFFPSRPWICRRRMSKRVTVQAAEIGCDRVSPDGTCAGFFSAGSWSDFVCVPDVRSFGRCVSRIVQDCFPSEKSTSLESGNTKWSPIERVHLNPDDDKSNSKISRKEMRQRKKVLLH